MQKVPVTECADGIYRAQPSFFKSPVNKTASYTIVNGVDFGQLFTNKGATGAIVFTLPTAKAGAFFGFAVGAAQTLTVTATGGAKINGGSANGSLAAAGSQNGIGILTLICADGVNWFIAGVGGTWA